MKLNWINFLLFFLFFFNYPFDLRAQKLEVNYTVEVGEITIGKLDWKIDFDKSKYKTSLFLKNKGLFSGLYKFTGKYFSEGVIVNDQFISNKYKHFWKTKKKTKELSMLFDSTMVTSLTQKPNEIETERINFFKMTNMSDPVATFLNILVNNANPFTTIDGRRVYKMNSRLENNSDIYIYKEVSITNYINIWTDHKKRNVKHIKIKQHKNKKVFFFPDQIKIFSKGVWFKLSKN